MRSTNESLDEIDGFLRLLLCRLPARLPPLYLFKLDQSERQRSQAYDSQALTAAANAMLVHVGLDRIGHTARVTVVPPFPVRDGRHIKGTYCPSKYYFRDEVAQIAIVNTGNSDNANPATLCHEVTHHILSTFHIGLDDEDRNERLTDVASLLLGLGWYLLRYVGITLCDSEWDDRAPLGYLTRREIWFAASRAAELCQFEELRSGVPERVHLGRLRDSTSTHEVDDVLDQTVFELWQARRQLWRLRDLMTRTPTQYRRDRTERVGSEHDLRLAMNELFLSHKDWEDRLTQDAKELGELSLARAAGRADWMLPALSSHVERTCQRVSKITVIYNLIESYYRIDWRKSV